MTLVRNGSNGGFRIDYPSGAQGRTITGLAHRQDGTTQQIFADLSTVAGSFQVVSDSDKVHRLDLVFGNPFQGAHHTEVRLFRRFDGGAGDHVWIGSITSTQNH